VSVVLAVCCCLSAARGQWLDKTLTLSDSFGNIRAWAVHYVPGSNCVYVADDEDGIVVLDAATCARVARIDVRDPSFFAYDSRDNKVYLSVDDTVAVVDPATHNLVTRLDVGCEPSMLSYDPAVNKLYCRTGPDGDSITVVDCGRDSVLTRIWVGWADYEYLSMSCVPAGNKVYVSSFEEDEVAVIDGVGDSLIRMLYIGDYPRALVYSPPSNKLYCAVSEDEEVAVFDAGPDTLLKLVEMGSEPYALGYSFLSNKVYSANLDSGVAVIDCAVDTVIATLGIDISAPTSFLFDSVDNRIFCLDRYFDSVPAISCSGDTWVGSIHLGGDAYDPDVACYNPRENRVYIAGRRSNDVLVVDAVGFDLVTGVQMYSSPSAGVYAGGGDKLYCSDEESGIVTVIDCSTDTLERRIFTPASELGSPVYCSVSNRLYYTAYLNNGSGLVVVDCAGDSFKTALPVETDMTPIMVYNPAMDRIYWHGMFEDTTVLVVDCAGESIVARVPVVGYPTALACNPDSNRVYLTMYHGDSTFISAIDCATDSVIGTVFVHAGYSSSQEAICYVPSRDVVVSTVPGTDLAVVDGRARQLLQTIPLGGVSQFRLDLAANKLYCLLEGSDELAAVDCRDMSIEATVRLAARLNDMAFDSIADRMWVTSPDYGCMSLVDGRTNRFLGLFEAGQSPGDITWVPPHRKMYVVDQEGQAVLVVGDTSVAGIAGGSALSPTRAMPTVVRGALYLAEAASRKSQAASLVDATGRKVAELQAGANDVRALAPGVYFVREEPQAASHKPQAVRKVVITR
jgi:YVTN family beta-propeller protein